MSVKFYTGFPGVFSLFSLVLLLTSVAAVPARAATPNAPECGTGPTAEFLNARLAFWQQRLNLQDWKLSVESSHPADLKPETLGNIHWDPGKKTAVVRVLARPVHDTPGELDTKATSVRLLTDHPIIPLRPHHHLDGAVLQDVKSS